MIRGALVYKKGEQHKCDNCKRNMTLIMQYSFCDDKGIEKYRTNLCEDCAGSVVTLFSIGKAMKDGKPCKYKYDHDEITEVQEPKTFEELQGNEQSLCKYCPLPEESQGIHCYGGEPVMCEGSHCTDAYENYLKEFKEDEI